MQEKKILLLEKAAAEVAETFSNRTPEISNFHDSKDHFSIDAISPMSEDTATVTFKKTSGKRSLAFFYMVHYKQRSVWRYFFPNDSHIAGMSAFAERKAALEDINYILTRQK